MTGCFFFWMTVGRHLYLVNLHSSVARVTVYAMEGRGLFANMDRDCFLCIDVQIRSAEAFIPASSLVTPVDFSNGATALNDLGSPHY
jgi:hypothetical protein